MASVFHKCAHLPSLVCLDDILATQELVAVNMVCGSQSYQRFIFIHHTGGCACARTVLSVINHYWTQHNFRMKYGNPKDSPKSRRKLDSYAVTSENCTKSMTAPSRIYTDLTDLTNCLDTGAVQIDDDDDLDQNSNQPANIDTSSTLRPRKFKLELPVWLMTAVLKSKTVMSHFDLTSFYPPEIYVKKRRSSLLADPRSLSLGLIAPAHFYYTGRHVVRLMRYRYNLSNRPKLTPLGDAAPTASSVAEEAEALANSLTQMLTLRFAAVSDKSFVDSISRSAVGRDSAEDDRLFDCLEKCLLRQGRRVSTAMSCWLTGAGQVKILPSELASVLRLGSRTSHKRSRHAFMAD